MWGGHLWARFLSLKLSGEWVIETQDCISEVSWDGRNRGERGSGEGTPEKPVRRAVMRRRVHEGWEGGRKGAGCPGALDPRAGAMVGKVGWVPSGSARSRAIPVGHSNTDADSVIKRA